MNIFEKNVNTLKPCPLHHPHSCPDWGFSDLSRTERLRFNKAMCLEMQEAEKDNKALKKLRYAEPGEYSSEQPTLFHAFMGVAPGENQAIDNIINDVTNELAQAKRDMR